MCVPLQHGLWPPPAWPGAGCWVLGLGWGAARWGPPCWGGGPTHSSPRFPPRCRQVPTCLLFPGFMSSLRPWLRAAPAAACLSLPIAFKNPLAPSRGPGPPSAGHGRAGSQAPGLGKSRCRWEVRAGAPQTRALGAHRRQLPRRGTARLGAVPVAPRHRDAALIRSHSQSSDGHDPSPAPRCIPGAVTIPSPPPSRGPYLGLGEPQLCRQLGALRQRQVLGLLEALVERLQLQAGVDGAGLAQLLPLAVDAQLPVGHGRGLLVLFGVGEEQRGQPTRREGKNTPEPLNRPRTISPQPRGLQRVLLFGGCFCFLEDSFGGGVLALLCWLV